MPVTEVFPDAFEIMGQWEDPATRCIRWLVRFFIVDARGRQVGRDAFNRILNARDLVRLTCYPQLRSSVVLELGLTPQEPRTLEEQKRVAELLRARFPTEPASAEPLVDAGDDCLHPSVPAPPKTQSFVQHIRALFQKGNRL